MAAEKKECKRRMVVSGVAAAMAEETHRVREHADAAGTNMRGGKVRAEAGWPWALAASRQRSGHSRRSARAGAQPYVGGVGATTGPSTCDRQ